MRGLVQQGFTEAVKNVVRKIRNHSKEGIMLDPEFGVGVCSECWDSLLVARVPHGETVRVLDDENSYCFHCGASGSTSPAIVLTSKMSAAIKPNSPLAAAAAAAAAGFAERKFAESRKRKSVKDTRIKSHRVDISLDEEEDDDEDNWISDDSDASEILLAPEDQDETTLTNVGSARLVDLLAHEYGLWEMIMSYLRPESIAMLSVTCREVSMQLWGKHLDLLDMEPRRWFGRTSLARCFVSRSVRRRWLIQGVALNCRDANVAEVLDVALEPLVLRSLAICGAGQRGLYGLSSCRWLTTLDLSFNTFENLAPLTALRDLRELRLEGCESIVSVEPLASCEELRHLVLAGCRRIVSLRGLEYCTHLEELDLSLCFSLFNDYVTANTELRQLRSLRRLIMQGCSQLLSCPEMPIQLEFLDLSSCDQLINISEIRSCANRLRQLFLSGCDSLTNFEVLMHFRSVQFLDMSHCYNFSDSAVLCKCTKLQRLSLNGCISLVEANLRGCTSLLYLNLTGCANLADLSGLGQCHKLSYLELGFCASLKSITPLLACNSLETINLTRCSSLKEITALGQLPALRRLCVRWCPQVGQGQLHKLSSNVEVVVT